MKRLYEKFFLSRYKDMTPKEVIADLEAQGFRIKGRPRGTGGSQEKAPRTTRQKPRERPRATDSTILKGWPEIAAYVGLSVEEAREYHRRRKSANRLPVKEIGRTVLSARHILDEWKRREGRKR